MYQPYKTSRKGFAVLGRRTEKHEFLFFPEIPATRDPDNLAFFGLAFGEGYGDGTGMLPFRVYCLHDWKNTPFEVCENAATEAMMARVVTVNRHVRMVRRFRFTEALRAALRKNTERVAAALDAGELPELPCLQRYLRGDLEDVQKVLKW